MPDSLPTIFALAALGVAVCGIVLHAVAGARLLRHLRVPEVPESEGTPPLTLWRALKGGVPDLEGKLEALARGSRAEDQILLGADAGSAEFATCEALRVRHGDRLISVVACERDLAPNPKISKFIQMAPLAKHSHWLLTDSEAMPDANFIESFRREWHASGADVQTAGYRFANLCNFPQALDASPALLTLWPGLMLAGRITFTLGACTGVKMNDVRALGGWETLGSDLAEDHQLGVQLTKMGRTVRLSRSVLTLDSDPMTWREYLRHQHRVAVTYRAATPAGALGLPVLHTLGFAAIAAALHPPFWKWAGLIVLARITTAAAVSRALKFSVPALPLAVLLSPFFETAMWLLAWLPSRVWWAGRWRRAGWRGRLG
ncbi:MAG: glycosyltransferase [Chthoniobacteraceae bacterium]